jgi:hypothetical protein
VWPGGKRAIVSRKQPHERVRPQIGDVIEIWTPRGLAYAQYTHEHREPPRYGSLLRVLPGLCDRQPDDLRALVEQEERFSVFFPLGAALARGIFRIVGNADVPLSKRPFPIFRSKTPTGTIYWDGRREWREAWWRRTPRWRRRAIDEIWNDTALVGRVSSDWKPADDP